MNFDDVIRTRRSVRKYIDKDVDIADIEKIVWAGSLAPSAHNRQPWEVVVLKKNKNMIVNIMRDYYKQNSDDVSILKTSDIIENCNTLLLVYCNNFEQYEYNLLSIGAMVENMILEAANLGISSVWIANVCPMKEEISKYLQIDSSGKRLVSAVALGYSNYEPKELNRKSVEEIITYV